MEDLKLNPRERARLEEERKNRKTRNQYIIIGVIVVILAALVIVVNSSLFTNVFPALRVNGTSYSLADVNYEYMSAYMQMANYGLFDTDTPLEDQPCPFDAEGGSWHDYFLANARDSLVQKTAFYNEALKAGTTLTEDDLAQLNDTMDSYSTYAVYQGAASLDSYLTALFGDGNNEKTVRAAMEKDLLIDRYLLDLRESFTFTDAEKETYYAENTDSLDKVNYVYTLISAKADEEAGLDEAAALAQAHEKADAIVAAGAEGEEAFAAAVLEQTGTENTESSVPVSSFRTQFRDTIGEDEITAGQLFTHESASGVYAVYVKGIETNDYNTVSVRHILIKAEDSDGDGVYSETEKELAHDAILAVEEQWKADGGTEEAFASLAEERSDDAGSTGNGGLYENVHRGQMVTEFDAFCFEPHEKGDTGIVWGESSAYGGYHLIYFVGEGDLYRDVLADDALRSEAYNNATADLLDGYSAEDAFMWRYVMKR